MPDLRAFKVPISGKPEIGVCCAPLRHSASKTRVNALMACAALRPGHVLRGADGRKLALLLRLPLARALLRLGELVGGHLARHRVAVLDRGGAVARVGSGKV